MCCAARVDTLANTAIGVDKPRKAPDPEFATQPHVWELLLVAALTPHIKTPEKIRDGITMPRSERKPYADDISLRDLTHTAPALCSKHAHELHGTVQRVTMKFRCARRHPAITEHSTDKISVTRFPHWPKAVSRQWKWDSIAWNQKTGSLPLPSLSPCPSLCNPTLVQRSLNYATRHEPDAPHLSQVARLPGIGCTRNELANRMVTWALVRPIPNWPGVPFLIEGEHGEALRHHLFDRAHRAIGKPYPRPHGDSSLCSHSHNPRPPRTTISSMRERYFDQVMSSAHSGDSHQIEGRSVSDADASTAP